MRRLPITLAAIAAVLSLPGPALAFQSTKIDNWYTGYDSSNDVCYMQTYFKEGNISSSVRIERDYDADTILQVNNDSWHMPTSDTTVEIWFDRNWQRPADRVEVAKWHNTGSETHLDIAFDATGIITIGKTDWMIIRTSTNGIFKNYNLSKTSGAVSAMWACDEEFDDWW